MQGPKVLEYLEHVVERHTLRRFMQFNTELLSAEWSDEESLWNIDVSTGMRYKAKYFITALGLLSRQNYPNIPGIDDFRGKKCHTAAWDSSIELKNQRVGVIGCGSTGVQVITEIAKTVKQLVTFQRHPQYSVPSGDGPVSAEYRQSVNARYGEIVEQVKDSLYGFGFKESEQSFDSFSPDERGEIFESLWKQGNGFRFLSGGFSDVSVISLHESQSSAKMCITLTGLSLLPTGRPMKPPANSSAKRSAKSLRIQKKHENSNLTICMLADPFVTEDIMSNSIETTYVLSIWTRLPSPASLKVESKPVMVLNTSSTFSSLPLALMLLTEITPECISAEKTGKH